MDKPDLSLIPMEDLIEELDERFDHWVFCGMQTGIGHKEGTLTMRKWKGNAATVAGLASQMQIVVFQTYLKDNDITGIGTPDNV